MEKKIAFEAGVSEWKIIFRVLHANLAKELELMDAEVFAEMQRQLHRAAKDDGVDVTDHEAWDAWLGLDDGLSCEQRLGGRGPLN